MICIIRNISHLIVTLYISNVCSRDTHKPSPQNCDNKEINAFIYLSMDGLIPDEWAMVYIKLFLPIIK